MSERGVFAVDRGIFEHPKFKDEKEPFTRLEAWLWLLGSAAWKATSRRISGKEYPLQRGQLVASTRYMAARWKWSEARVRRFLDALKTDASGDAEIDASTDAGITIITIRKYDEYQRVSLPRDASTDAGDDAKIVAEATQQRRNEEDTKNNKTDSRSVAKRRDPAPANRFDEFWAEYPRRDGPNPKKTARAAYEAAVKSGADEQAIIAGAKRYRADLRRRNEEGTRFVPQAVTWLRQARWMDDAPTAGRPGTNAAPIVIGDQDDEWRKWMRGYTVMPAHRRVWYGPGGEPGYPGCEVPASIQREFGFTPVPWVRRDGTKFGGDGEATDDGHRQAAG